VFETPIEKYKRKLQQRFVEFDKNSENKVRKERIEAEKKAAKEAAKIARELAEAAGDYIAPSPVAVSKSKLDVRSGEVFSFGAVAMGIVNLSVVGMGIISAGVTTMGIWEYSANSQNNHHNHSNY
jgi:hypothetical protein